ncbi:MAG: RNA polymerase sigma factor [Flavobacteriales bacterium]
MSSELQDIIKGCVKRDYKYQKLLYAKYASLLYAICLRYLKNTDDAKDALQDCFIKVYDKISSFNNDGSFEGWLKRLTVNNCLMLLREKKKAVFVDEIYIPMEVERDEEEEGYDIDKQTLFNMIQDLPDGYRTVFNLYVIDGFSHKEIAEKIGIQEGTSKSQLARAKKILREKITLLQNGQEKQHRRVV